MLRNVPTALVVAALLVAMPSTTLAGTQADPEITDPADDGGPENYDLVKVWVDNPAPDQFAAHFELPGDPTSIPLLNGLHIRLGLFFVPTKGLPEGMTGGLAIFRYGLSAGATAPAPSGHFAFVTAEDTYPPINDEVAVVAQIEGPVATVMFGVDLLPGFVVGVDRFTSVYAVADLVAKGPLRGTTPAGGVAYPEVVDERIERFDRAPDSGYGRDFPVGGSAVTPPSVFELTGPSASVEVPRDDSTTVPIQLKNLGTGNVTVTLTLGNVTEGFEADVVPPTLAAGPNETATANLTVRTDLPAGSQGSLEVIATSADNVTMSVLVPLEVVSGGGGTPGPSDSPGPTDDTDGPEPTDDEDATSTEEGEAEEEEEASDGGGIPAPGLVIALLALLGGFVGRRRRA